MSQMTQFGGSIGNPLHAVGLALYQERERELSRMAENLRRAEREATAPTAPRKSWLARLGDALHFHHTPRRPALGGV